MTQLENTRFVRTLVCVLLPSGKCSIEEVARAMGVDRRTVHRRLDREGMSFTKLVDDVRKQDAIRLLADDSAPMWAIAATLGFECQSVFARWFRQKFGRTPSAYQRMLRGG